MLLKATILGDSGVGKTSLMNHLVQQSNLKEVLEKIPVTQFSFTKIFIAVKISIMGAWNAVWQNTKRICTVGLIAVTVNDRYATFAHVQGSAAHSAIAPGTTDTSAGLSGGDVVFVEKFCLENLNFSRGDVVVYRSCRKPNQTRVMRLTALPGDWIPVPESNETLKIPMGHCWVESDIPVPGAESSEMILLGIVRGRATHRVWPLNKFGKIERSTIVRRALHHR